MYDRERSVNYMKLITLNLEPELDAWLSCRASERNTTKAELIKTMIWSNKNLSDLVSISDEEFDEIIYG